MWVEEDYQPDEYAKDALAKFREFRGSSWLACEVLLAIRGWSEAGSKAVSMELIFSRFWPCFEAYPSMAPEQVLASLQTCGAVEFLFEDRDPGGEVMSLESSLLLALLDWRKTGHCDGKVCPTGLVKSLRDAIGFSLSATRDLNVPGAEVIVSALPDAPNVKIADVATLMPFRGSRRAVYEKSIRPACEATGLSCMRADEFYGSKHVMAEIVSLIKKARIVVSDISELNPNVLYETGLAHALGKRVLIITERGTKVPFDVQHLRRIEYSVGWRGKEQLSAALETALADMLV